MVQASPSVPTLMTPEEVTKAAPAEVGSERHAGPKEATEPPASAEGAADTDTLAFEEPPSRGRRAHWDLVAAKRHLERAMALDPRYREQLGPFLSVVEKKLSGAATSR